MAQFDCTPEQHTAIITLAHQLKPSMPNAAWCDVCQAAEDLLTNVRPMQPTPISLDTAARRKAAYHATQGIQATRIHNGWLVPSSSRCNVIHFVNDQHECSCEAAANHRQCWHTALVTIQNRKRAA